MLILESGAWVVRTFLSSVSNSQPIRYSSPFGLKKSESPSANTSPTTYTLTLPVPLAAVWCAKARSGASLLPFLRPPHYFVPTSSFNFCLIKMPDTAKTPKPKKRVSFAIDQDSGNDTPTGTQPTRRREAANNGGGSKVSHPLKREVLMLCMLQPC